MIKHRKGYVTDHYVEGDVLEKPRLRKLDDGSKVATFKVRNIRDYIYREKGGIKVKNRMYHEETKYNCVAWNEKGEDVEILFQENDKVWIRGYMRYNPRNKGLQFVVNECGKL